MRAVISGLGTSTMSVASARPYALTGSLSLPGISKGDTANSQVVTVIKQNASTIFTSTAGAEGLNLTIYTAAGDVISVITSSSAAIDKSLNVVKGVFSLG